MTPHLQPGHVACLVSAALLVAVVAAGPTAASCAAPGDRPRLSEYDSVFAGDVLSTSNGGRVAEVRVVDVWSGPDLPPRVVVVGGETGRGVASSVDREYLAGRRYVFFVHRGEDGALHDNACTPTSLLAARSALDPPGVRAPQPDAPEPNDPRGGVPAGPVTVAAALVVAASGALLWSLRRRLGR